MMSQRTPRMTLSTQLVLQTFLEDPKQELYGLEIGAAAGLPSGTVHPILARLEGLGWVESRWEDIEPRLQGRPSRRYYKLTASGEQNARDALARAYRPSTSRLRLKPAGEQP
jgi:PadR family transcriptional regulator, regulatory protein PadR